MLSRLSDEKGQGMIELILAVVLITVALLALMASYDSAFMSIHKSARTNAAAALAESQLELYSSVYGDTSTTTTTTGGTTTTITLPLADVGLSSSLLSTAKSSDAFYSTDENSLSPSGTDVTSSSCTTTLAQCKPVQTVTGLDGKTYRVETFIRDVSQSLTCTTATTTTTCGTSALERDVTVIVRDPNTSGTPKVYTATAAFDCGPRNGTVTTSDWCPS